MKIKKTNTAFTIIELLVVMVVIGILATVSVATFGGNKEKARLGKIQAECTQYIQCENATNICNQNGGSNCESLCDLSGLDCAPDSEERTEYLAMIGGGESGGGIGGGLGGQTCADLGVTCGAVESYDFCEYHSDCASGLCYNGGCLGYALGMGAQGDYCDYEGTTLECQAGLYCSGSYECETIGDRLPDGSDCNLDDDCISENCGGGDVCVQEEYFYLDNGESCEWAYFGAECKSRYCSQVTDLCEASNPGTKLNGASCTAGDECLSGYCSWDTCESLTWD